MDGTKAELAATLKSIRESVERFDYRLLLRMLHHHVFGLLESKGQKETFRGFHTGDEKYANVAIRTDKAAHLLRTLGYEPVPEHHQLMVIKDYESHVPTGKRFLRLACEELRVCKCDPKAKEPLRDEATTAEVSLYLAYHLYINLQLLIFTTDSYHFDDIRSDVDASLRAIELTSPRLVDDVMKPGGATRRTFDVVVEKVRSYVTSNGVGYGREEIDVVIGLLADSLRCHVIMISEESHCLWSYLQNMQAVVSITSDGRMLSRSDAWTYLGTSSEVDRAAFSARFVESLDRLGALVEKSIDQSLNDVDIDAAHKSAVWLMENIVSEYCPRGDDVATLPMSVSETEEDATAMAERIEAMTEQLKALKEAVGVVKYNAFVRVIHFVVEKILLSDGAPQNRCINKRESTFAVVSADSSDMTLGIMRRLGFDETDRMPYSMYLYNYSKSKPVLQRFADLAAESALLHTQGDPARFRPIDTIHDFPTLVLYLAYHLRLRLDLLCLHTAAHVVSRVADEVSTSIKIVEALVDRLGVLHRGSVAHSTWTTARQNVQKYVARTTTVQRRAERRFTVHSELSNVADAIALELGAFLPFRLVRLMSYAQNMSAVVGITSSAESLDDRASRTYISTTDSLVVGSFSDEYWRANETLRDLVRRSTTNELTDGDVCRVYELTVWQADNILSHFRPEAFDLEGCGGGDGTLTARATSLGLSLSSDAAAAASRLSVTKVDDDDDDDDDDDGNHEEKRDEEKRDEEKRDEEKRDEEKRDESSERKDDSLLLLSSLDIVEYLSTHVDEDPVDVAVRLSDERICASVERLDREIENVNLSVATLVEEISELDASLSTTDLELVCDALTKAKNERRESIRKSSTLLARCVECAKKLRERIGAYSRLDDFREDEIYDLALKFPALVTHRVDLIREMADILPGNVLRKLGREMKVPLDAVRNSILKQIE